MAAYNCDFAVKELVEENSESVFLKACEVLIKFASNIIDKPKEEKFRQIKLTNKHVQEKLLIAAGGIECLFAMGFQESEDGDCLVLPADPASELRQVLKIREELIEERNRVTRGLLTPEATRQPAVRSYNNPRQTTPPQVARSRGLRIAASAYKASEAEFLARIKGSMSRVMNYEVQSSQSRARDVIPVQSLELEAKNRLEQLATDSNHSDTVPALDGKDCLLLSLLRWFKQDFFHWVDALPCENCGGSSQHNGSLAPSQEDMRWSASRVEAHKCTRCGHITRFPRYTNAVKLLETKRGRCGEWADCFTLCCRALGFEARYVLDWTDHVWTEVFSPSQQRWMHCDPCENTCDKPLLYEGGWGKKLSYVIAFSKDEVQDVSWRYSAKHKELISRRSLCRESWLRRTVHQLWKAKVSALPEGRRTVLWSRLVQELTEFLAVKMPDGEVLPGRTTGSVAWRQARGELGGGASKGSSSFVFKPTESETASKLIHVTYSSAEDTYVRISDGSTQHKGWGACVNTFTDVIRKEEHDWKMAYLARRDGSSQAQVVWKFDVSGSGLKISKLEIKASSAVYESGKVAWRMCAGDQCDVQSGANLINNTVVMDIANSEELSITAVMSGGKGGLAWQHTQLFRQSMDARGEVMMDIKLHLV